MTGAAPTAADLRSPVRRPRLGFLGAGWIGLSRLQALAVTGLADPYAIADPDRERQDAALSIVPRAHVRSDLEGLLALDLDGVVIATPSALHADQAITALEHGLAVFCQKPLGRDADESAAVIDAARRADRLLGVDLSYRHLAAVGAVRRLLNGGAIGRVFAADLTFHNAYGPDKSWFTERSQSGGGCLIDLGTHLVDLALWLTGSSRGDVITGLLLRQGDRLLPDTDQVEDFARAQLHLDGGVDVQLACSWFLSAGRDCRIELAFYGTEGAAVVRNVGGSFYDFCAEHRQGTHTEVIAGSPDDWGGRALTAWARQLAGTAAFDPAAFDHVAVARILDDIYRAGS